MWAEIQADSSGPAPDTRQVYWHHVNHQGTTEVITDKDGTIVWDTRLSVYGSVLTANGSKSFTPTYTGKDLDSDTGLYYFNFRWYDSELGRFISEDPARDGINWYGYCGANPMMFTDPWGLLIWPVLERKAQKQRQKSTKGTTLGNNPKGSEWNVYHYGCFLTALTNIMNSFKTDKNKVYTPESVHVNKSNEVKNAFDSGNGLLKDPLEILNQNSIIKKLNLHYETINEEEKIPEAIQKYADDKEKGYFLIGVEKPSWGGSHFFNIVSAPDEDGYVLTYDPYKKEGISPYVKKKMSDMISLRVIYDDKPWIEQVQSMEVKDRPPEKGEIIMEAAK